MALDKMNLVQLAKTVAKADRSTPTAYSFNGESFDYDTLQDTLRAELNEYAGTYALYRENKNLIFSVIEEVIDDKLVVMKNNVAVAVVISPEEYSIIEKYKSDHSNEGAKDD